MSDLTARQYFLTTEEEDIALKKVLLERRTQGKTYTKQDIFRTFVQTLISGRDTEERV